MEPPALWSVWLYGFSAVCLAIVAIYAQIVHKNLGKKK